MKNSMLPRAIVWLQSQSVPLACGQFTIDWCENTILDYLGMQDENCLPDEGTSHEAMQYRIGHILEIMRPELPDVKFFNSILDYLSRLEKEDADFKRLVSFIDKV